MGCTRVCRAPAAATLLVVTLLAPVVRASGSEADLKAARKLFLQAEQDEDSGRWSDALAKLRDVAQVKLTAGVRYHIALCEQNLGQLASALEDYVAAERQSHAEEAQDVLHLVGKRLEDLRARVPRLTVRVVPPRADAVLTLDGKPLTAADADAGIPVDPGPHHLEASAPEATPSSIVVTLHEHEVTALDIHLPTTPPASPPPAPVSAARAIPWTPSPREPSGSQRGPAIVTTVGAVALAAGGLAAFLLAGSAHDRGLTACAGVVSRMPDACDPQRNSVRAWDFVAAGAWATAVAVGTVAVLLWTSPPGHASTKLGARVGVGPRWVELNGQF